MKIAIGTKSEQKLGYISEVLEFLEIEAELLPSDVKSNVSDQPLTSEETKTGSINRAKAALEMHKEKDFSLGIEFGYNKSSDQLYEMICWASIYDGQKVLSSKSIEFPLPKFHREKLENNFYLADYVRDYYKNADSGLYKYMRELVINRRQFIFDSVRDVLVKYLLADEF